MSLWKVVEKAERSWTACSGCSGDYEDPDRTAWQPDEEPEDEVDEIKPAHEADGPARQKEFPEPNGFNEIDPG